MGDVAVTAVDLAVAALRASDLVLSSEEELRGFELTGLDDESLRALAQIVITAAQPPEPVECRDEFEVRWHGDGAGIIMGLDRLPSAELAHTLGACRVGEYGIAQHTVWRREHRTYTDGSAWSGPWQADDTAEVEQ